MTSFLRPPTRADLNFIPQPKPMAEPRYFRRELWPPRNQVNPDSLIYAIAIALLAFCLGFYLAS